MAQEVVLIRHTSLAVKRGHCYGFSDIGVSDQYDYELNALKKRLKTFHPDFVYSSPLSRCTQLALSTFNKIDETNDALKELNYGDWENKTWASINIPEGSHWMYLNPDQPAPNGESFNQLQARVVEFFKDKVSTNPASKIAIFCHGGIIRSLVTHLLGIPLSKSNALKIHYTAHVHLKLEDGIWKIFELNQGT